MKPFGEQTFYELLDLPVTATTAEIHAAYGHAALLYGPDSVALYSLVDPQEAEVFRHRLHEALETLSDPSHRAAYNRALGVVEALADTPAANPENQADEASHFHRAVQGAAAAPAVAAPALPVMTPVATPVVPERASEPPALPVAPSVNSPASPPSLPQSAEAAKPVDVRAKAPDVGPDTEFSGEMLRRLREAKGYSLQNLADRTRISRSHLENVEADRYARLPPTVYLRGFLTSVARELKVDPQWVCRSYLALVAAAGKR